MVDTNFPNQKLLRTQCSGQLNSLFDKFEITRLQRLVTILNAAYIVGHG